MDACPGHKPAALVRKALPLLFSTAVLLVWLAYVGPSKLAAALSSAVAGPVAAALPLFLLTLGVKGFRLHAVVNHYQPVKLATSLRIFFGSFFLDHFFSLAGVAGQIFLFHAKEKLPAHKTLSLLTLLRVCDYVAVFFFLAFLPLTSFPTPQPVTYAVSAAAGVFFAVLALLLFFAFARADVNRLILRVPLLPRAWREKAGGFLALFFQSFRDLHRGRVLFTALLLTLVEYLVQSVAIWILLQGFGLSVPIVTLFLAQMVMQLFYLVPNVPGELGTHEAMITLLFSGVLGYPRAAVGAAALASHLISSFIIVVLGTFSLGSLGLSVRRALGQPEQPDAAAGGAGRLEESR